MERTHLIFVIIKDYCLTKSLYKLLVYLQMMLQRERLNEGRVPVRKFPKGPFLTLQFPENYDVEDKTWEDC